MSLPACLCVTIGASLMLTSTLLAGTAASSLAAPAVTPGPAMPTDDEIREILRVRIDKEHRAVGIVVGIVTEQGTRIITHGKAKADAPASPGFAGDPAALSRPLDGDTVFEIGSITKPFTATILADMARKGELSVEDPVAKFLPTGVKMPSKNGKEITLRLLAQHLSALPRMPSNFRPANALNPYADYGAPSLYEFLKDHELRREPGAEREYSNLAYGLLGHALSLKAGKPYEQLLHERITGPLGMNDTVITLTPELRTRLAHGHDLQGKPESNWDLNVLQGAGAIRSTVNDMLKFAAANAGITATPLRETIATAQERKYPPEAGEAEPLSLAWGRGTQAGEQRLLWHNGGTGGYRSNLVFNTLTKVGVVVLSNGAEDIDDIAFHIIEPSWPVDVRRTAITLAPEALDRFTGVYEIAPNAYREIFRYRDRLFLQRTGQPVRELQAESATGFFSTEPVFQLLFELDAGGRGTTATVVQSNGVKSPAKRVDRSGWVKKLIEIDPAKLDDYAGRFEDNPEFIYTIRRDGERLFVQVTSQTDLEIFPIGPDRFTYLAVDAELAFVRDAGGKVVSLVKHQLGTQNPAKRIK